MSTSEPINQGKT